MYQLYIANKNYSSWSLRPWVLMRELGIPFEEKVVPFSQGSSFDDFHQFSPTGKVPCLIQDQTAIWDSLAITEYLAESYPQVWPKSSDARAWARCASAEMHSGFNALRNNCPMNVGVRVQLNQYSDELKQDLSRLDELWTQGLKYFGGPFLAGSEFSAVDAFFAPVIFRIQGYSLKLSNDAHLYVEKMLELASMQRWQNEALKEIWRTERYENEINKIGVLLQDLRN